MRTTACYIRVSTVGQNAAGQRREIMRWLEGKGLKLDEVATALGVSRRTAQRYLSASR